MSADQTNITSVTPVPGGYRGETADSSPIYDLAIRIMQETGATSVLFQVWAEEPGKSKLCHRGFTILILFARRRQPLHDH